MKIKTKDLKGAALDWAVCAALEKQFGEARVVKICRVEATFPAWMERENAPGSAPYYHRFSPSTDREQGMEIIEREGISTRKIVARGGVYETRHFDAAKGDVIFLDERYKREMVRRPPQPHPLEGMWMAKMPIGTGSNDRWLKEDFLSPTLLIAAMRCYVASKLGAEVDVPDELA